METVINQFRDAMHTRGIIVHGDLKADASLHRCDTNAGMRGRGEAAYVLHLDGIPAGGFENWRDGLGWENWKADIYAC